MEDNKHNGSIALWKFIYCIIIIALHVTATLKYRDGTLFAGASICVSFFFIVSGYLMEKKALKNNDKEHDIGIETKNYILNKVLKIFPYTLIAHILCIIAIIVTKKSYSTSSIISSIWELLFLGTSGIKHTGVNYVTWYISAMFISMLALYPLILKLKKKFIYVIGPLIIILVGGYISFKYNNLSRGPIYKLLLMAIFQLSIGVVIYEISEKIKNIKFTNIGKFLLGIIELFGFSSILFLSNIKDSHNKYDFIMLLILTISIAIAFSEQSIYSKLLKNKFFYTLEKYSIPLYLNQVWIIEIVNYYLVGKWPNLNYFAIVGIVVGIDILASVGEEYIIKLLKKIIKKLKKVIINDEPEREGV